MIIMSLFVYTNENEIPADLKLIEDNDRAEVEYHLSD